MTEDEMDGWHHRLNGHRFGQTPGVGDERGGLACCGSWGHKEPDMAERAHTEHDWLSALSTQRTPAYFSGQMLPLLREISGFTQLESILTFHILEK